MVKRAARKLSRTMLVGLAMIDAWQKNGANVWQNKLPLPSFRTRMALVSRHMMTTAWEITSEGRGQLEALRAASEPSGALTLEVNPRMVRDKTNLGTDVYVMTLNTTADDFWLARVRLSDKQGARSRIRDGRDRVRGRGGLEHESSGRLSG